ncbi:MAG: amidohydrolase family protein [Syntrophobacteraceae bacterium]
MSENSPRKSESDQLREVDWLLLNADWLVKCDPRMSRIRSGAVAIEGDLLAAVGTTEELRNTFRGRREVDLSNYLLMPGLVNTHTHAAMSLFRGIGDDLPLKDWLEQIIFPLEGECVNPESVYLGTMLSAVEMIKGGTTTFCDGYFFEEHAAQAAFDSGMRAVLGQGILDFPSPGSPDPSKYLTTAETFLANFPKKTGRVQPSLFCHAPYTCSPLTMKSMKGLCRQNGILFQTHLSESAAEVEEITQRYGRRPAIHLDSLGVLDELTICAHGIWLSQEEKEILARTGASISHCPESAMKLASGIAPIPELIASGVRVGLGTDGCASNNDLDLFREMDMLAKLHKVFSKDPLACPADQALFMATLGGASALGLGEQTGSIQPGKKADLIAISLDQPHLVPVYDPVSLIVYAARGSDVRFSWIDGNLVLSEGKLLSVDEAGILAEARLRGAEIARRISL